MKLNAVSEMIPVTWKEFSQPHPFSPVEQMDGYRELFTDLKNWLRSITGFLEFHYNQMREHKVSLLV